MIVITTVGSSLVENLSRFLNDKEFEKKFTKIEKCKKEEFTKIRRFLEYFRKDKNLKEKYSKNWMEDIKKKDIYRYLKDFSTHCFPNASAELTSLHKLRENLDKENKKDEELDIYLIISDTNEGYFVGEILKEALESEGIKEELKINKVELKYIEDLRIDSTETFKNGLNNLIDTIYEVVAKDKNNQTVYGSDEVIFNITGGYKGVIPYISTIAQIFCYEVVYTFESIEKENDLISVEPLPIELEKSLLDLYYPFLKNLDKLSDEEKGFLIKKGLLDGNKLTPLGKILLLTSEKTVFKEDAFGQFVEYLVYEYFVNQFFNKKFTENNCLENFTFEKVETGKSLDIEKTDIDIYLENSEEFVWIEIKPITYLLKGKNFKSLIKQIKNKQLIELNFLKKKIHKYILTLYSFSIDEKSCKNKFKLINENKILQLEKLFENKKVKFEICYFCLSLAPKDIKEGKITSRTYQKLFKNFKLKNLQNLKNILEE
ncbi:hypothetical protein [Persephonella sp.]|uniref:hypothetical protein n=1 Tax=Persephonella sp. TaxID=2060922 RepID=UPI0026207A40|nr:hypothetical protein [Persephonella sp.]